MKYGYLKLLVNQALLILPCQFFQATFALPCCQKPIFPSQSIFANLALQFPKKRFNHVYFPQEVGNTAEM